jgi:flagellar biosynthesis/type III secretory pathway protein FliH
MEAYSMATRTRKKTFEEVFTEGGLIPKWIAQGKKEGKKEGRIEGIAEARSNFLELLNQGLSIEEIKKRL